MKNTVLPPVMSCRHSNNRNSACKAVSCEKIYPHALTFNWLKKMELTKKTMLRMR